MKLVLVHRIVLVASLLCVVVNGDNGDNDLGEHLPEKSRFKKFLNLFGIGTMKQFQPGQNYHDFSPYGYPCQTVTTTTTTPAPLVSPMLCPFPPMMPGQARPGAVDIHGMEMPPKVFPRPVAMDQLPPPPPGALPFPAPPSQNGQRPPGPLPGGNPQSPFPQFPHPPNGIHPGMKPVPGQFPQFPGQPQIPGQGHQPIPGQFPPFPGQNLPHPSPVQTLPQQIPHQNLLNDPTLVRPQNPLNPEQPMLVDPENPENPIKVNPSINNPYDPVKVNPSLPESSQPVQVSPVDIYPSLPLLIDPVRPGQPLQIDPTNISQEGGRPIFPDPSQFPSDPKEFSKHQPFSPYGPMNVLVNPGLPDLPHHTGKLPMPLPPPLSNSIDSLPPPPSVNGEPNGPPPPSNDSTPIAQPEPRPTCASPFLKPYIPNGFHFSSVKQLIGFPPLPNQRLFPCPTLDLLTVLEFKTMRKLIVSSGLAPLVDHTRNYTLFVPSDAAFRRLPKWFRESLEADAKLKKALVLNHLVKQDLPLDLLQNEELVLSARPGANRLRVNIYQPENSYRTITVDGSEIEIGDILSSNGRVHVVNKLLMPNLPRNGAQFLSEKLEFESFWNLVKQADLVQKFQDEAPFTLFIPINEAVQKLNDTAFLNDKDKLKNFVNYHMVNGSYYSNGLINNEFLLTNYEKEIKTQVVSDVFSKSLSGINGKVKVLKADITLTNGVAHVIDQCISEETPFYVYPQSDEFKNEFGVMRRNFRVDSKEKNIENAFK